MMIIVFNQLIDELKIAIQDSLPGMEAQRIMAPSNRMELLKDYKPTGVTKKGSVLILLYPYNNKVYTVLMLRPDYGGVHSGQVSFPGGKREAADQSDIATALRETREELGIDPENVRILGELSPLYIPPSDFLVTPVVGYAQQRPPMTKDPVEVEEILEIPLDDLLHEDSVFLEELMVRDIVIKAPCYKINEYLIWGATAMIMSELLELIKKLASTKYILAKQNI
ncbi:MAG: CoA pyrophosphatase [Bacteroidales bacterium]|nr:CoA pyrophosphatase [Bacteroidales bacterium]